MMVFRKMRVASLFIPDHDERLFGKYTPLSEEYVLGGCRPGNMVATPHNMSDGREERVARYKEERRRELEARYGPRTAWSQNNAACTSASRRRPSKEEGRPAKEDSDTPPAAPRQRVKVRTRVTSPVDTAVRSTKASRLRTRANLVAPQVEQQPPSKTSVASPDENRFKNGDFNSTRSSNKEEEKRGVEWSGSSAQSPSNTSSPRDDSLKNRWKYGGRWRSVSPAKNAQPHTPSTNSSASNSTSSSPLPRSSQLVRRANTTAISPGKNSNGASSNGGSRQTSPCNGNKERRSSSPSSSGRLPSLLPVKHASSHGNSVNGTAVVKSWSAEKGKEAAVTRQGSEDRGLVTALLSPLKHRQQPSGILKKHSLDETSSRPVSILKSKDRGVKEVSGGMWNCDEESSGRPRATVVVPAALAAGLLLPGSHTVAGSSSHAASSSQAFGSHTSSQSASDHTVSSTQTASMSVSTTGHHCVAGGKAWSPQSRGILKKHRSLDEPPHTQSRILPPENGSEDMRPILKSQNRRCSLEELKRMSSPDRLPHSILKRKTVTGATDDTWWNHESDQPPGILKRKGSSPLPCIGSIQPIDEDRRPILKKRSSREEPTECLESHPPSHPPRPILKKKSLDEEEPPCPSVRPILKSKSDEPPQLPHDIKPILKHSEDNQSTTTVVYRSNSTRCSVENRRSLDSNLMFTRAHSPSEEVRSNSRPLSIAERIFHLESSREQDVSSSRRSTLVMEEEDGEGKAGSALSRSSSVSERASLWNKLEQESRAAALRPPPLAKVTRRCGSRDASGRFSTQPVTLGEVEQARRNNKQQQQQEEPGGDDDEEPSRLSLAERVRLFSSGGANSTRPPPPQPTPPSPRHPSAITHSATSSIVSGLLKNIRDKAGGGGSLMKDRHSGVELFKPPGWESSDDEGASSDSSDSLPSPPPSPPRPPINRRGMVGGVAVRRCGAEPTETSVPPPDTDVAGDESDAAPVVTIAQRLAALKRSGSTDWKKRVKPQDNEADAGGGVGEVVGRLEKAGEGWRQRVETKDNVKFTVAGKMGSVPASPISLLPPLNRVQPQPHIFSPLVGEFMSTPVSPDTENSPMLSMIKRSASAPGADHLKRLLNGASETTGPLVKVPEVCDEEFHSFFPGYSPDHLAFDATLSQDVDFELLASDSNKLLLNKRRVRAQRKHHSANPLKALAKRSDLKTEYVEVRSGIAEKERIRLNLDKLSKTNPGLAVEAVAGLASREELTSVVLRKSADTGPVRQVAQWSHPLLLRTKGRRHPVTSLVPPHYSSVNQGDSFTLVTPSQVFSWTGEFCNVIEKSRGVEVATEIQTRRDMGCLSATKVVTLDGDSTSPQHEAFWTILDLPSNLLSTYRGEEAGHPDEDEMFETALSQSYRVYQLSDGALVPLNQAWARHPKVEFLHHNKVMVFDLVTEVFCWCGKGSSVAERRQGARLASELSKEPAWTPCGIPWLDQEVSAKPPRVYSVTQHMEPVLFRQKFVDWPDFNRNNLSHRGENGSSGADSSKACDIKPILSWTPPQPDLVLENSHLGRGNKYYDLETRRYYHVATQEVKVWRIEDYAPVEVSEKDLGQFYDTHSYIIKWNYTLTVTGRELSGEPSKHQAVGRERCAYWTWQGRRAGLEAGTASLLSVGMQQGAPQVRVKEGLEPPTLQAMMPTPYLTVHCEKLASSWPKLYLVEPGQDSSSESALIRQLQPQDCNLRSGASFLYLPRSTSTSVYLWHGCRVKPYYAKLTEEIACTLLDRPDQLGLDNSSVQLVEINEGEEPKDFFNGGVLRKCYSSELYSKETESEVRLKMFELTQVKGVYTAVPVSPVRFNPEADRDKMWRYVYSQEELYNTVSQCVLVDNGGETVWLWMRSTSPSPTPQALTSQMAYARAHSVDPEKVVVVCQGVEPPDFRALFPWWCADASDVESPEDWRPNEVRKCSTELSKLSPKTYPLHQLTTSPLPAGVDPTRLHAYLSQQQFEETFNMSREEFESLTAYKQKKMKEAVSL